jgi:hypothetical protein
MLAVNQFLFSLKDGKRFIKYYCVEREIYVLQESSLCLLQMAEHEGKRAKSSRKRGKANFSPSFSKHQMI